MMVKVRMTPSAFMKMQTLIMGYDKEVGWWGTVEQLGHLEYRIKDILIFPQYTSAAYIDDEGDDPLEMTRWLDSLPDEVFNEKRFFGHSHVEMSAYFSGNDIAMFNRQRDAIKRAEINRFYLSVVINKFMEVKWWVYDGETDKEYKDKEIEFILEIDDAGLSNVDYFENSKELVRDTRLSSLALIYKQKKKTYGYNGGYSGSYNANQSKTGSGSTKTYAAQSAITDPYDDYDIFEEYYGKGYSQAQKSIEDNTKKTMTEALDDFDKDIEEKEEREYTLSQAGIWYLVTMDKNGQIVIDIDEEADSPDYVYTSFSKDGGFTIDRKIKCDDNSLLANLIAYSADKSYESFFDIVLLNTDPAVIQSKAEFIDEDIFFCDIPCVEKIKQLLSINVISSYDEILGETKQKVFLIERSKYEHE